MRVKIDNQVFESDDHTDSKEEQIQILEKALMYLGKAHVEGPIITNPIVVSKAYYLLIELHKELKC